MTYTVHWIQTCLVLHNMIVQFEERLGRPLTMPWVQQEAHDLHREYKNVVVQVPVGLPGQLFHATLMSELFMALGLPYTINEGQE